MPYEKEDLFDFKFTCTGQRVVVAVVLSAVVPWMIGAVVLIKFVLDQILNIFT